MTGVELLGLVMLLVMLGAIFIGLPISFTLLFLGLMFGFAGMEWRVFDLTYLHIISLMKQDEFVAGPMMIKAGYDVRMSAGSIAASGTLGILIPPSVMLVVMAPVLEVSIVDLYAASFGPGFLLAAMY